MDTSEVINSLQSELLKAEHVLDTEYSFDLAEPNYRQCLLLIERSPGLQVEFEKLLIDMYSSKKISDEPLAYLMHVLRWSKIRSWLELELANNSTAIATGSAHEKVLAAYREDWPNREFYKFA